MMRRFRFGGNMRKTLLALSVMIISSVSFSVSAADSSIQKQLDAQQRAMLEMQNQLDFYNQQIASLRGDIEKLQYDLNKVKEQMANTAAAPSAPAVQNANSSQQQGSSSGSNSAAPQNRNNQASAQNSGFTLEGNLKTADAQAKAAYDNAYKFVTANNLAAAEKEFSAYLQSYPDNSLTPNAWYWLGQVQYKQNKLDEARVSFLNVARFTATPKRPDSLYKLGLISKLKGDKDKAKQFFELVINKYPADTAANLSRQELQNM